MTRIFNRGNTQVVVTEFKDSFVISETKQEQVSKKEGKERIEGFIVHGFKEAIIEEID